MAGNSQRRGAIKKTGKGNPTAGSGGRRRKGLEGKGPTPRASERPNHKAYKMANASAKREQARPRRKPKGASLEYDRDAADGDEAALQSNQYPE